MGNILMDFWSQRVTLRIAFKLVSASHFSVWDNSKSWRLDVFPTSPPPFSSSFSLSFSETGSVDTSDQVMVVASCSLLDDASQQQQTWAYYPGAFANVKFVSTRWGSNQRQHPTHFQRSTVNHHALKLLSGEGDIYEGSADFATLDFPQHA